MPPFALLIALAAMAVQPPGPRAVESATARAEIVTLEQVRPQAARTEQSRLLRDIDRATGTIEFY